MIKYPLKWHDGHQFESWFQSARAYDALKSSGHLSCASCGSGAVEKAIMAPRVSSGRAKTEAQAPDSADTSVPVAAPDAATPMAQMPAEMRKALQDFKQKVEAQSDYVGPKFAEQARAMHLGDAPERAIYGEANAAEAKALIDDGVPVMPLPFLPTKKAN